jgi:energy-converting hydrogenase Eha subunit A
MTDVELEKWIRENPWKANVIFPAGGIATGMFVMYVGMQIIDSAITGKWL